MPSEVDRVLAGIPEDRTYGRIGCDVCKGVGSIKTWAVVAGTYIAQRECCWFCVWQGYWGHGTTRAQKVLANLDRLQGMTDDDAS